MIGAKARRILIQVSMAVAGLAILCLGIIAFAPLLVSSADLRRMTIEALSDATGQEAGFTGEAYVSLFPAPRLVLSKVVFPMSGGSALDAEGAVVKLRLLPLLFGRLEAANVTLERPTLVLTDPASLPPVALGALMGGPGLPELRLVQGTIALRDENGLTKELISGIDAKIDRGAGGRAVAATAAFAWRDRITAARLALSDAPGFITGRGSEAHLDLSTGDAWVRFRGKASGGLKPTAQGDVTGEAPSLRALLEWVGVPAPTSGGFGAIAFSASMTAERTGLVLTPVKAELDGNQSEGALNIRWDGPRPSIQGTFAADRLDVTPYGRLSFTYGATGAWDRAALNVSGLNALDFDLRLSAANVKADQTLFQQVATSAVLRSGRLVIAIGNAKAWGGSVRTSIAVGPALDGPGAALRIQAEFTDVALGQALDDVLGVRRLEGMGTLEVLLEGSGRSIYNISQSLSGGITLNGTKGYVLGIDVAQVLRRIERRPLSGGGDLRGGRTSFDSFAAQVTLERGTATLQEAVIAGKQVHLSLEGTVSVPTRDVSLKGEAVLLSTGLNTGDRTGGGFDLPFLVQGSWDSPYVMLDPQSLIRRSGAAQPLLDAVRSNSAGEAAVRSVLDQLAKPTILPPAPARLPGN